jgi:valyl-tRNA synthetase
MFTRLDGNGVTNYQAITLPGNLHSFYNWSAVKDSALAFLAAGFAAEGVTVELDTAATIDVAAERRRMEKDLAAARKESDQAERKLANDGFLAKAPGDVVDATRRRLETARADIARISGRLAALAQGEA